MIYIADIMSIFPEMTFKKVVWKVYILISSLRLKKEIRKVFELKRALFISCDLIKHTNIFINITTVISQSLYYLKFVFISLDAHKKSEYPLGDIRSYKFRNFQA